MAQDGGGASEVVRQERVSQSGGAAATSGRLAARGPESSPGGEQTAPRTQARGPQRRESTEERAFAYAEAVGASLDLDQIHLRTVHGVAALLGDSQCLLFEYDSTLRRFQATAAAGLDVERLLGMWASMSGQASDGDARRWSCNPDPRALNVHEGKETPLGELLDLRLAALFPLAVSGQFLGALLCIAADRRGRYSTRELRVGQHAGMLAAQAIQNARELRSALRSQGRVEGVLARMSQLREQERKVFSGLIHDDVLQCVVGAVYALEALRDSILEAERDDFDHIVHMLRMSMESARKIIWDVRPPVLEGLGLEEALCVIADRIAVQNDITVHTNVAGGDRLGDVLSSAVYKIGREALLNAEHNAHASFISLSLTVEAAADGPVLVLEVKDDGEGFDPATIRTIGHFGLVIMREQAVSIGGDLRIDSAVGRGTTVELTVPLLGLALPAGIGETE